MINVVGLGYIGLPTALMFASHGVEVVGTDYNKELVETLNQGRQHLKKKDWMIYFKMQLQLELNFLLNTYLLICIL